MNFPADLLYGLCCPVGQVVVEILLGLQGLIAQAIKAFPEALGFSGGPLCLALRRIGEELGDLLIGLVDDLFAGEDDPIDVNGYFPD